jgi:2'-5' RNA ligase
VSAPDADERARLFVALELPGSVREALVQWRGASLPQLRVVRGEDLHVTLCFLGWQRLSAAGEILRACQVAADWAVAPLVLRKAIWLPPRRPRVLAVSLEDRDRVLAGVQGALSGALGAGGWYIPEKRPFLAHVTVARVARGARVRAGTDLPALPVLSFEGSRVTLFRSRLSPAGARYEPLGTVVLG